VIAAALLCAGCSHGRPGTPTVEPAAVTGGRATATVTANAPPSTPEPQDPSATPAGVAAAAQATPTPAPPGPSPTPTPPAVASLAEALAQGWVRGEIRGNDARSGDSAIVNVQRTGPHEITLTVPPGALLVSGSPDEPNMVVQRLRGTLVEGGKIEPADRIRLSDDAWHAYLLEAYSLDFGRGKASPNASFLMVEPPASEVSKVVAAADKVPGVVTETLQTALWAITDGVDAADLAAQGFKPDLGAVRSLFEAAGLDPARKRLFDASVITTAQGFMARGDAYYRRQEYAQAMADYTRAIALQPAGYPDALYRRGSAAVQLQDYDRAIADFGEVIRLRPNNPLGYYSRGIVSNAKPNPDNDAALADLEKAIQLDPRLSDAYHALGLVYAANGDYEQALQALTQALRIDPGFVQAYHARGSVYSTLREYDRAAADFSAAIGMQPDYAEAFRARGLAYAGLGDPVLAIQDFRKYLALAPAAADRQSVEETIATLQGTFATPAPGAALALPGALARGLVQLQMHGLGVASGDSVLLTAQRAPGASGQALEIGVPQGVVLRSAAPGEADMVVRRLHGAAVDETQVRPEGAIRLADDQPQRYFLEAYSLDSRKNDPGASTALSIGTAAITDTLRILQAADRMPEAGRDILAIQAAIWAARDDVTWEELIDRGCQPDLRVVRAILTSAGLDPGRLRLFGGTGAAAPTPAPPAQPAPTLRPTVRPAASTAPTPAAAARPTRRPAPPAACPNPNVQITSPGDGQVWQGAVKVLGNAAHPEFQRFDLQFRSAEAPDQDSSWRFLATGTQPVQNNGQLMEWVTTTVHPDGDYRLRLRVVQRNGNYEDCVITAHIQN
jgi:tetratricopeptide (TPR) repeat protein